MNGAPDVPEQSGAVGTPPTDVLELRIHGVSNTPPPATLGLAPEEVEPAVIDTRGVHGDALGAFWRPSAAARHRDVETGPSPGDVPRDGTYDPRRIPAGVRREAYSWGAMARLSWSPLGGRAAAWVAGAIRLLWVVVVPFGMVNVAYWARRIPTAGDGHDDEPVARKDAERRLHSYQFGGAAVVRLFALVLTLLLTSAVLTVSLDLVGTQCLPDAAPSTGPADERTVCAVLPGVVQGLAFGSTAARVAWLSAVPVVVLLGLWALARRTRVHYEESTSQQKGRSGRGDAGEAGATGEQSSPRFPLLSTSGFWTHRVLTRTSELVHLAAGLAFVATVVGWSGAVSAYADDVAAAGSDGRRVSACVGLRGLVAGSDGSAGVGCDVTAVVEAAPVLAGCTAVGLLVLLGTAWRTVRDSVASADVGTPTGVGARVGPNRWAVGLVAAAGGTWVGGLVALAVLGVGRLASGDGESPRAVAGLGAAPTALVAVLLGLGVCAVAWRSGPRSGVWFLRPQAHLLYLGVVLGAAAWALLTGQEWARWTALGGAVALGLVVALTWFRGRVHHGDEAWWGAGPAVFLLLAAGFAMLLVALLVLGAHALLLRSAGAATFEVLRADGRTPREGGEEGSGDGLLAPDVYEAFGVSVALALVVVLVVAVATFARRLRWIARPPDSPGMRYLDGDEDHYVRGVPGVVDSAALPVRVLRVLRLRQHAAAGQRAEIVVGTLAVLFLLALVLSLLVAVVVPAETRGALVAPLAVRTTPALGAAAALLAGSIVVAGGDGASRPAGVLWDLMCFLPRAPHPFGPPCYAERVVPEVRGRVEAWLGAHDLPEAQREHAREHRRVVLVGHSNGGMLAAAVVLARSTQDQEPQPRLALLTAGTQLRGLFGRLFPELFGPRALGTRPLCRPRFWGADPWLSELPTEECRGVAPPPSSPDSETYPAQRGSLRQQLTARPGDPPRWRNLWRRTDFIGFPVCSYAPNPVDRGAEELDPRAYTVTVWHHSDYPAAPAYRKALDELVAMVRA